MINYSIWLKSFTIPFRILIDEKTIQHFSVSLFANN